MENPENEYLKRVNWTALEEEMRDSKRMSKMTDEELDAEYERLKAASRAYVENQSEENLQALKEACGDPI